MKLRTLRESAGLTQRGLARLARISRSSVSHVETGRYPPTAAFAGKVCRALSEELGVRIQTWDVFPGRFEKVGRPRGDPLPRHNGACDHRVLAGKVCKKRAAGAAP